MEDTIVAGAFSRVDLCPDSEEDYARVGNSRFGGDPDLPFSLASLDGLHERVFLFQVNFSELKCAAEVGLPTKGWLYVFSDLDADEGTTFYFDGEKSDLIRHPMPPYQPDYIFSEMEAWKLRGELGLDLPRYGSDEFQAIREANLEEEYSELDYPEIAGFCQLCGRFAELNGDLRIGAAEQCGGKASDWRSLWKVLSSHQSGLVISDFHVLHGMIKSADLSRQCFDNLYSTCDVV